MSRELSSADQLRQRVAAAYEKHRDGIYRFLAAQGLPVGVAQEVAQDVFVKLFVALTSGKEITSEQGWLYSVAARSAVDHWRAEGKPVWVELEVGSGVAATLNSPDPDPEERAARTQQLRRVAAAMAKLPREQLMCIQLRSQGLRYQEIAGILGVAISTVAAWLSTAVERLRGAAHD